MARGAALLLIAALGCGSGGARPQPPEPRDELVAAVERALGLVEQLAAAAEGAGVDCAAMLTGLDAVARGPDGDAIRQVDTAHAEAYAAREAELDERFGARMSSAAGRLGKAIEPCGATPGLVETLVRAGIGG